ncbi:DKNYY domain-containing protein [uncultured Duncaniella sp.]|uniref:DKNYY domain-containing protein n=1 Tax=uncultured Duncaniella sp. TaxID=2768039 RepID=UPI0025A68233|nr:DKNYY domain-containing protein [uncultured Duncaniella sp.]
MLRDGYAKDTWNVYFYAVKIEGASPDSFKVLRDGYAKDTWNTYYFGRKID